MTRYITSFLRIFKALNLIMAEKKSFKIWNSDKSSGYLLQAQNFEDLEIKAKEKFEIASSASVRLVLSDNCEISDEDAFQTLASGTEIILLKEAQKKYESFTSSTKPKAKARADSEVGHVMVYGQGISKKIIAVFGLLLLAIITFSVGLSTPNWVEFSTTKTTTPLFGSVETVTNISRNVGLWTTCRKDEGESKKCGEIRLDLLDLVADVGWIRACRAFSIIGIICLALAIVGLFLKLKLKQRRELLQKATIGTIFAGGASMFLAVVIAAAKKDSVPDYFFSLFSKTETGPVAIGYSFALAIVGMLLAFASGVVAINDAMMRLCKGA